MLSRPKIELPPAQAASGPAQTSEASVSQLPLWTKPVLSVYGDVRQLTMGTSPATGESAQPLVFRT